MAGLYRYRLVLLLPLLAVMLLAAFLAEPLSIALTLYFTRSLPAIPLPFRPPPRDQAEAKRQDVRDLALLPGFDRSFSPEARDAFQRGIDRLSPQAGAMSPASFQMAVSRLVALAGNAHTSVNIAQRADGFGRLPLRFAWFADGLYVVRATSTFADMLGMHVMAIDGRSVDEASAAVRPFISGTPERARANSTAILESPALLQTIWSDTDGLHLRIIVEGGGLIMKREIVAMPPAHDPFGGQPFMAIGPAYPDPGWKSILSQAPTIPMSLLRPERVAIAAPLEKGGLYVRINANGNDARGRLEDQLATILAAKPPGGWRWIALDLRFNDGGDEMKTAPFTRALPGALTKDGQLYILTANTTFSAAIITAARAKYFLKARAHIVGEKMGDHDQFWTDGGPQLVLRNSGIAIQHAYFLHDWVNGCSSIKNCYPPIFIYGVVAGDLSPEITVGWRFADYVSGRDTVMETVKALAITNKE